MANENTRETMFFFQWLSVALQSGSAVAFLINILYCSRVLLNLIFTRAASLLAALRAAQRAGI